MKKTKFLSLNVEMKYGFGGKDIAKALGYSIPRKAIREHIDPEDRSSLEHLSKGSKMDPP